MSEQSGDSEWIRNGWNIATRLLAQVEPQAVGSVSTEPVMVLENRFALFYALDLSPDCRREFWIITGEFPPAIADAGGTLNERDAVRMFGALYRRDGCNIQAGRTSELSLPDFAVGPMKHDAAFGAFLEQIGCYLEEMARTFPWEEYGIRGKIFS
jgi:hypothetical protein